MAKPTIFIPGFPASELRDKNTGETLFPPPSLGEAAAIVKRLVDHPDDAVAGPPILDKIKHFAPAASTLYEILSDYGISEAAGNFVPIGWDWRLSVAAADTFARIKDAVDNKLAGQGKIVAILHSTGGLVFRAFLQANPNYVEKFEHVLAFAIPWRGTLESLHAVSEGVPIELGFGPIVFKTFVTAEQSKDLLTRAQAAYDLFPTDKAMELFFANGVASTPLDDRSWLDPNRPYMKDFCDAAFPQSDTFANLPVTNVCGWGGDTWPRCDNVDGQLTFKKPINEAATALCRSSRRRCCRAHKSARCFFPSVHSSIPRLRRSMDRSGGRRSSASFSMKSSRMRCGSRSSPLPRTRTSTSIRMPRTFASASPPPRPTACHCPMRRLRSAPVR